jgi:transposase-like protein
MARRRHRAEQIITRLREAEVALAQGQSVAQVCKRLEVAEQTYYRWRKEYGGMQIAQAKRLKQLEGENARLRRAVADLTVANQILQEAAEGNC